MLSPENPRFVFRHDSTRYDYSTSDQLGNRFETLRRVRPSQRGRKIMEYSLSYCVQGCAPRSDKQKQRFRRTIIPTMLVSHSRQQTSRPVFYQNKTIFIKRSRHTQNNHHFVTNNSQLFSMLVAPIINMSKRAPHPASIIILYSNKT